MGLREIKLGEILKVLYSRKHMSLHSDYEEESGGYRE